MIFHVFQANISLRVTKNLEVQGQIVHQIELP